MMNRRFKTLVLIMILVMLTQQISIFGQSRRTDEEKVKSRDIITISDMTLEEKVALLDNIDLDEIEAKYAKYEPLIQAIETEEIKKATNVGELFEGRSPLQDNMSDYYDSWTKITRNGVLSFSLDPKNSVRFSRSKTTLAWYAFTEEYDNDSNFTNYYGLRDQYYCHSVLAKFKSRWNIEPSRPNVSWYETLSALCNP